MNQDFKNIILGCQKRNRNSQHQLYKLYYSYGMRIGIRYVKNEEEAIKVLNSSFMKVYAKISKYQSESDFRQSFAKIIQNTALKCAQKGKRFSMKLQENKRKYVLP